MKQQIGRTLAGAAAGFIFMYLLMYILFDGFQIELNIPEISFELTIIFMVASIILIFLSLVGYAKIKAEAKKEVTGDEEDELDERLNKICSEIILVTNMAIYFSIFMLAIVAVTDQHNAFIFISLAFALVSFSLNILYSELMKMINPDRKFPSVNDKEYAKKLMEISDEGERHVMLQGMYRAYTSQNSLLFFAILLLIAYSVISGVSQLFGIFIIVLILVITNMQYMLTNRNK